MPVSVFRGLSALLPGSKTLKQNAMLLGKLENRHTKIADTFKVSATIRAIVYVCINHTCLRACVGAYVHAYVRA